MCSLTTQKNELEHDKRIMVLWCFFHVCHHIEGFMVNFPKSHGSWWSIVQFTKNVNFHRKDFASVMSEWGQQQLLQGSPPLCVLLMDIYRPTSLTSSVTQLTVIINSVCFHVPLVLHSKIFKFFHMNVIFFWSNKNGNQRKYFQMRKKITHQSCVVING